MESTQKAALTKFGNDNNIEVVIDRETGEIKIQKTRYSREDRGCCRQITLEEAKKINPNNELKLEIKYLRNCPK